MNLLLDTCVMLWWLDDTPTLAQAARAAIAEGRNLIFVSAAVIWEIRIKAALGKLIISPNFREVLEAQPFVFLNITPDHAHAVADLPPYHRDPFDRMLVAQTTVEGLTLVTRDTHLARYHIPYLQRYGKSIDHLCS